ncbi:MAG TPA: divalent-cation tolerance protein CutA [Nitrospira sp.]|nr:divalent-cation tolerance protein CutA [Nitrospira sp.]
MVLITASNRREAVRIGAALVKNKLAACATLISSVTSIFRWKGKVQKTREALVIVKTTMRQYAALERSVLAMHSYEVPEIIALSVDRGLRPYLEWVDEETATY